MIKATHTSVALSTVFGMFINMSLAYITVVFMDWEIKVQSLFNRLSLLVDQSIRGILHTGFEVDSNEETQ